MKAARSLRVAALPLVALLLVRCGAPDREYYLHEAQPHIDSRIPRVAVSSPEIPIDKKYRDLSEAEKEYLNHGPLEPGNEPAFPKFGLKPILIAIRDNMLGKIDWSGDVTVVATVNPDGVVLDVKQFGSPPAAVSVWLDAIMRNTRFKRAMCHGLPCAGTFSLPLEFRKRLL